MIEPMRDLGVRLLIGLAVVVVAVMAVGYAFIFSGVATPPRDELATLDVPPDPGATAAWLDDGRPVFVTHVGGTVSVVDPQASTGDGALPEIIAWCADGAAFVAPLSGRAFGPDGTAFGAGPGLTRFTARLTDDGRHVVVQRGTSVAPAGAGTEPACTTRVAHEPAASEVFDPSVAADLEPPGWIWLSGTLRSIGGQALLCDGEAASGDCATGAVARGIDPAGLPTEGLPGLFIGAARDGGIEGLALREAR